MITIRKNTFETNSSSTHAICFGTNENKITSEELHKVNSTFKYWTKDSKTNYSDYINVYTTLEDKLTWLLTSMKQAGLENPFVINMKYLLEKIMPNATFDYGNPDEHYYEFEDIDWLWNDWNDNPDGWSLLNEPTLIKFLCEGVVVWGDRDYYNPRTWGSFIDDKIAEYPELLVRFSG